MIGYTYISLFIILIARWWMRRLIYWLWFVKEREDRSGCVVHIRLINAYNNPEYRNFQEIDAFGAKTTGFLLREITLFSFSSTHASASLALETEQKWVKDHRYVSFREFCHFAPSHLVKSSLCASPQ